MTTNGKIIISGVNVIDGNGGTPLHEATVVLEGNRIAFIGRESDVAESEWETARLIDGGGQYLLPGLQNHHEHLDNRRQSGSFHSRAAMAPARLATRSASNALRSLLEGVTTIRDLGAKGQSNLHIRETINEGILPGPRVFACGEPLAITGGHAWEVCRVANGVPEVRQAVREQVKAGADFIKLMASGGFVTQGSDEPTSAQYSVEEVTAAVEEAKDAGKKTTVHAHSCTAIRRAVEAGVDCIEHGALIDRPTADLMAERGIFLVPTISEIWIQALFGEQIGRPAWLSKVLLDFIPVHSANYRKAVEAGVKQAVGTDVIGDMVEDMRLMAYGGLSNMEVIQAATRNGAELLDRLNDLGTIEAGKLADLILVRENPLEDLRALREIAFTIKDGVVYDPALIASALSLEPDPVLEVPLDTEAVAALSA